MTDQPLDAMAAAPSSRPSMPDRRSRSPLPWVLLSLLLAFTLGLIANPFFEREVRSRLPAALQGTVAPDPRLDALATRIARLEGRAAPTPARDLDERLARLEQAVRAGEQSAGALANSNSQVDASEIMEARALFVLLGVRRAVAYGQPLGPYDGPFTALFGARDAASVRAVRDLTARPVTRASLRARLQAATADASPSSAPAGMWQRIRTRLGSLVEVRRSAAAQGASAAGSVQPSMGADAAAAAEMALATGRLDLAIAAVARVPATTASRTWIADAQRLAAGEAALTRLEALALSKDAFTRAEAASSPARFLEPTLDMGRTDAPVIL